MVEVGYVARAHGVRGELRIKLHNPESTALLDAPEVFIAGEAYPVIAARDVGGAVLLVVDGVSDRSAAERLRGAVVTLPRDAVAGDDEDLLIEFEGCEVVLADGSPWGHVDRVEVGLQHRLVIRDGDVERELPLVPELVLSLDREARRVVVAPPEGLPETRVRGS